MKFVIVRMIKLVARLSKLEGVGVLGRELTMDEIQVIEWTLGFIEAIIDGRNEDAQRYMRHVVERSTKAVDGYWETTKDECKD